VAEAALEARGFLHQRIEREIKRLRPPTHFGDLPVRAHGRQRQAQGLGTACSIDDHVHAQAVADGTHGRARVLVVGDNRGVSAQRLGNGQPLLVLLQAHHAQPARPGESRQRQREKPNRPGT
jgi:hypothetical protein